MEDEEKQVCLNCGLEFDVEEAVIVIVDGKDHHACPECGCTTHLR